MQYQSIVLPSHPALLTHQSCWGEDISFPARRGNAGGHPDEDDADESLHNKFDIFGILSLKSPGNQEFTRGALVDCTLQLACLLQRHASRGCNHWNINQPVRQG
jgi:hypothetical protein